MVHACRVQAAPLFLAILECSVSKHVLFTLTVKSEENLSHHLVLCTQPVKMLRLFLALVVVLGKYFLLPTWRLEIYKRSSLVRLVAIQAFGLIWLFLCYCNWLGHQPKSFLDPSLSMLTHWPTLMMSNQQPCSVI